MRLFDRKSILLAAMFGLLGLLALPAVVQAQAQPPGPAVFGGTAIVNGVSAATGTSVVAVIDGIEVASTTVSAGIYAFSIAQPVRQAYFGKTITFRLEHLWASQTAIWEEGGGGELNLTTWVMAQPQDPRPSVFGGTVSINGVPAVNGTVVSAIINGKEAASTTVSAGSYAFSVAQPAGESFAGKVIVFMVGNAAARETAIWQDSGGAELNLSAGVVAQQQLRPPIFKGKVIVDGGPAPDGTIVAAIVGGNPVPGAETKVIGGTFAMLVIQPPGIDLRGKVVEFWSRTPDGRELTFPQTAIWESGEETSLVLELQGIFPQVIDQREPTHVFKGEVFIDGHRAEDGTILFAYIDGQLVENSKTLVINGRYRLEVAQPPDRSFFGKMVEFGGITVDGKEGDFPQTEIWFPDGETIVVLEQFSGPGLPSGPFLGQPSIDCIIKVLGRIPAGLEDMTNQEMIRVAQNCMSGGGAPDDLARLDQERARIEMENALREQQQRLEEERLVQERRLQEERDRLERERMERDRARQAEQARLDKEFFRQEQERIQRERDLEEQRRLQEDDLGRQRVEQERRRLEQQLALDRERIDRERALDEERARLDQERIQQEQRRIDQEFAQREEQLRREVELNLQLDRQRRDQEQRPRGEEGPPSGGDPPSRGPTRGFFTNSQVGQLGSVNNLMEPTTLAILGILFTLGATTLQLFKGS